MTQKYITNSNVREYDTQNVRMKANDGIATNWSFSSKYKYSDINLP